MGLSIFAPLPDNEDYFIEIEIDSVPLRILNECDRSISEKETRRDMAQILGMGRFRTSQQEVHSKHYEFSNDYLD